MFSNIIGTMLCFSRNRVSVLLSVTSQFYHVPNNCASWCEDQIINPEYLGENLINLAGEVFDKKNNNTVHRLEQTEQNSGNLNYSYCYTCTRIIRGCYELKSPSQRFNFLQLLRAMTKWYTRFIQYISFPTWSTPLKYLQKTPIGPQ